MKRYIAFLTLALASTTVSAATVYGNSASFGNNPIHTINGTTGVESARFTGQPSGNGRGVVVVGNDLYYTVVGDSKIYRVDRSTGTPTGFIQTSNASMATLAWDGSQFWTADYSGTNQAFRVNTSGVNTSTISLANAQQNMDGLEWFNGKLIGNRCDACGVYDIYDLSGNVLTAGFISTNKSSTGIAFDGTNFLVSDIFSGKLETYDGLTGAFLSTVTLTGSFGPFLIEDLSVDYATRPDTGGVPEPASWAMLIAGFGLTGASMRRRRSVAIAA